MNNSNYNEDNISQYLPTPDQSPPIPSNQSTFVSNPSSNFQYQRSQFSINQIMFENKMWVRNWPDHGTYQLSAQEISLLDPNQDHWPSCQTCQTIMFQGQDQSRWRYGPYCTQSCAGQTSNVRFGFNTPVYNHTQNQMDKEGDKWSLCMGCNTNLFNVSDTVLWPHGQFCSTKCSENANRRVEARLMFDGPVRTFTVAQTMTMARFGRTCSNCDTCENKMIDVENTNCWPHGTKCSTACTTRRK
ncbi:hypothetical protein M231_05786 [Tremella mesenterica]|uniref:Uncharacterized protein n=1 Tax=Tremella mesenterica TaxID=5217 RepID=A0A4Q1BH84_TREME|nr:hypothetical protein M231_05786 [Tremella mesenterica]